MQQLYNIFSESRSKQEGDGSLTQQQVCRVIISQIWWSAVKRTLSRSRI